MSTSSEPGRITLTAAGELRDALTALQNGNAAAAVSALMAIDAESWRVIEKRLAAIGCEITDLLTGASDTNRPSLPSR